MDLQSLINLGLSVLFGIIGWIAKTLWDAVGDLKMDLSKLREDLPKTYINKEDHRQDVNEIKILLKDATVEIKSVLDKIWEKVDRKADK